MNFIRICVSRPVGVSVGVLLIVLFGLLSLYAIPVQLTPNLDVPVIVVRTGWRGADPLEIEHEIVDRQEEMLRSVKGLRKMTSSSTEGRAQITLELHPDIDKSDALRDVNDKLRQVTGYPLEADEPTVQATDPATDSAIAWLTLYSGSENTQKVRELRDFAEDYIKPYLDRVPGVGQVNIYGGLEREVQVRVNAGQLAARGLTLRQVQEALRRQNENISAGTRSQGKRDYTIRTVGQYRSMGEILNTVVAYTPGGPVYLRDVAEVERSFRKPTSFVRSKGQYVLAFPVRREVGSNVIQVMDGLHDAIARVNDEILASRGMKLDLLQVYDETVYINQAIRMVQTNIVFGGTFAIIVLMLFLRNWRATLVVALSIPISVIGTFVFVVALGRTLNVISLAGIAFAVGMVVDSAVVVLENIYRHRQLGKSAVQAALDGTHEVWGAVLASTLTTMAVFVPVIFVREEAGQLFRDISIATATAVGLSLIVSVTVIPALAARLLGVRRPGHADKRESKPSSGRIAGAMAGLTGRLNAAPAMLRIGGVVGALAVIVVASGFLKPPTTYLPSGNRNLIFGSLVTPPGYGIDEFRAMNAEIEKMVRPYWQIKDPNSPEKRQLDEQWIARVEAMLEAGQIMELAGENAKKLSAAQRARTRREWLTPPPLINNFFFVAFNGGCFMGASSIDPDRVKPLARLFEMAGKDIPGIFAFFQQASLFRFGGGNNAEIQVRGDDLDKVMAAAEALYQVCSERFSRPKTTPGNFNLGRPEVRIIPDRERAADLGLNVRDLGFIVEAAVDGAFVGEYREQGGDTIDIALYVQNQKGSSTQDIGQIPIYAPAGRVVPLSSAVKLVDTTALEQIIHVERQRAVTLTIEPPEAVALESVIRQIKDEIEPELRAAGKIDPSVMISLTGNASKLVAARNTMVGEWQGFTIQSLVNIAGSRFFLSVLIVYLLMAALFESWLYPFVIMFSVPIAIFGGLLGLRVANFATLMSVDQPVQQLDVLTFLGFVILVGLVVNNAILLVHQALHNIRKSGMDHRTAIREAVRVRVRPVFMTSLTTFFGQLPLALMPGSGSELYRGLASVMLGGMLVGTIGTLLMVPVVLGLVYDARALLTGGGGRAKRPEHGGSADTSPETPRPQPAAMSDALAKEAALGSSSDLQARHT